MVYVTLITEEIRPEAVRGRQPTPRATLWTPYKRLTWGTGEIGENGQSFYVDSQVR
jgi:hypothetical protein